MKMIFEMTLICQVLGSLGIKHGENVKKNLIKYFSLWIEICFFLILPSGPKRVSKVIYEWQGKNSISLLLISKELKSLVGIISLMLTASLLARWVKRTILAIL